MRYVYSIFQIAASECWINRHISLPVRNPDNHFPYLLRGVNLNFQRNNGTQNEEVIRVRVPKKKEREILGIVESMLGANKIRVRCMDGVVRLGRIPGKLKKRTWIREGDVVILVPWDFQDEKGDVKWRYTRPQVDWLEKRGYLKG